MVTALGDLEVVKRGNVSLTGCGWQRLCRSRNRNRGSAIPTGKQVN